MNGKQAKRIRRETAEEIVADHRRVKVSRTGQRSNWVANKYRAKKRTFLKGNAE